MQMTLRILLLFVALVLMPLTSHAQTATARGKATVSYPGKAATAADKDKAVQAAQFKALEFYFAESGQAETENFDAIRERIAANPDRYFLDTTVLSDEDVPGTQKYSVAVKVTLNVAQLRNAVKGSSATAKAPSSEKSQMAFLFVARQEDSVKSFDDRVYKRAEGTFKADSSSATSREGTEKESVGKTAITTSESEKRSAQLQVNKTATLETGGSSTRRSNESTWRLMPSANLAQVFTSSFAVAGYRVVEAAMVEPYTGGHFKVALVQDDYKSGNDLKSDTLTRVVHGMRTAQIRFLALGTLDTGMAQRDSATGQMRVSVTVNGKVLDLGQTIPETVASVGPVQYAGIGATEDEARTSALKLAATSATRELTSQLTNLGLR